MTITDRFCGILLQAAAGSALLHLAAAQVEAAPGKPHIEGLALGMTAGEVITASRRPCSSHPFAPTIPGIVCADPGQSDVSMSVALTQAKRPEQVFALLLSYCSRRSFSNQIDELQGRYGMRLDEHSAISGASRGATIGKTIVLAFSQNGRCASGENRFNLMIGDRSVFASETATAAPLNLIDRASDKH